jgi:hypothetical protein
VKAADRIAFEAGEAGAALLVEAGLATLRSTASIMPPGPNLTHRDLEIRSIVARCRTTTDIFNAIGDALGRQILDLLVSGEKTVGATTCAYRVSWPCQT